MTKQRPISYLLVIIWDRDKTQLQDNRRTYVSWDIKNSGNLRNRSCFRSEAFSRTGRKTSTHSRRLRCMIIFLAVGCYQQNITWSQRCHISADTEHSRLLQPNDDGRCFTMLRFPHPNDPNALDVLPYILYLVHPPLKGGSRRMNSHEVRGHRFHFYQPPITSSFSPKVRHSFTPRRWSSYSLRHRQTQGVLNRQYAV